MGNILKLFFNREKIDKVDLEYMSEVEAALHRQGNPWAYRLSLFLVFFFVAFIAWAGFTERTEVIRGDGHIVLSRGVQPIQSADGGIITEILVSENQEVEKDQVLTRISNTRFIAELHDLKNKEVEHRLALVRLTAENDGEPLVFSPLDMQNHPEVVRDQVSLFDARLAKHASETRELQAQLEQKRGEVQDAQLRRETAEKSLLLLKQQEERMRPLIGTQAFTRGEYLQLRQRIAGQETDLNALAQSIARTQSAVITADERLKNLVPERKATLAAEMNKTRQDLDAAREGIAARDDRVSRTELRSPMRGVVKRILLKRDSVARQAETIMEILPLDDTLEVVARFHPKDRGFLETGQVAVVKISAYDFSIYGGLDATVFKISADTIEDSRGAPWYEVRLQTTQTSLPGKDDLDLKVGMTVQVDVHGGEKSILAYLMKPLIKTQVQQNVIRVDKDAVEGERPDLSPAEAENGSAAGDLVTAGGSAPTVTQEEAPFMPGAVPLPPDNGNSGANGLPVYETAPPSGGA